MRCRKIAGARNALVPASAPLRLEEMAGLYWVQALEGSIDTGISPSLT